MHKKSSNAAAAALPDVGADNYIAQLIEDLKDPAEAAAYLEAALQEGNQEALLLAMRQLAAARGGMTAIAQQTGLSRESLYRAFSKRGNPTLTTLSSVLAAAGLRLSVLPA